jgi:HD-like signal output (HDOD) protein
MSAAVATQSNPPSPTVTSIPSAERLVTEIGIPPCPAVLAEFMAESHREEPDVRRLSHLVSKDAALAASVIKTVNSPFYGLGRKARTIQEGLTLLGLRAASRMIAGFLLRQAFASHSSPAMYDYWDASSHIALIAAYLARELEVSGLDEAHTFALFRDCGVPVLLTRFPGYEKLLAATRCSSERERVEAERLDYGYDHALVGAVLAQNWFLPSDVWQAIRAHPAFWESGFLNDDRNERFAPVIAVTLLAEQLYRIHRGTYDEQHWQAEERFIAAVIGPVAESLEPLVGDVTRLLEQQ